MTNRVIILCVHFEKVLLNLGRLEYTSLILKYFSSIKRSFSIHTRHLLNTSSRLRTAIRVFHITEITHYLHTGNRPFLLLLNIEFWYQYPLPTIIEVRKPHGEHINVNEITLG